MINVRKGTPHSLAQTDFTGAVSGASVVAGMLVEKNTSGDIVKASAIAPTGLLGFAVTNEDEGDAIESQKIGAYALGTGGVVETDQFTGTYTIADIGKPVIYSGTAGKVKAVTAASLATGQANAGATVLGHVYDAPRSIYVGFTPTTVLPILLD